MKHKTIKFKEGENTTHLSMSKEKNSQYEIKSTLLQVIEIHLEQLSKMQEQKGIPKEGVTMVICEVGIDNKKYDLTLCLTEKGYLDKFIEETEYL